MCLISNQYSQVLLMFVLLAHISVASADIYKWVDAAGNTHYSQQKPPAGIQPQVLKAPPDVDAKQSEQSLKEQQKFINASRKERQERKQEQRKASEEKARKEKNCEIAKARYKSFAIRPTVQLVQEDGSRVRATEEQRQKQISEAQDMIKEFCN